MEKDKTQSKENINNESKNVDDLSLIKDKAKKTEKKKKKKDTEEIKTEFPETSIKAEEVPTIQTEKLKDEIIPKVISILPKNPIQAKRTHINFIFIFKREEFYIQIKEKASVNELKKKISEQIKVPQEQFDIIYKGEIIQSPDYDKQLSIFFNVSKLKSRPILEIKKKVIPIKDFIFLSNIYRPIYSNKVHIEKFPNDSLNLVTKKQIIEGLIEEFFNQIMHIKDYKYEIDYKDGVFACFSSPDLAFDFNRYMLILKRTNEFYKDCKITLVMEKNPCTKKLNGPRMKSTSQKIINPIAAKYICMNGEYLSEEERRRKEYKESKKKWVCDKDFILNAWKYSGVQI